MIYLIRTAGINEKKEPVLILKIGYTDDSRGDRRFNDYRMAGLDIEVLYKIPGGSEEIEHELQRKFKEFCLPWRSKTYSEWFFNEKFIEDTFKSFTDIDSIINYLGYDNLEDFMNQNFIRKRQIIKDRTKHYRPISSKDLLQDSLKEMKKNLDIDDPALLFYDKFCSLNLFSEQMRLLCECSDSKIIEVVFKYIPNNLFEELYNVVGPERCSAMGYIKYKLTAEYNHIYGNQQIDLSEEIYSKFELGKRYTLSDIKDFLIDLYNRLSYKASAKATDLDNYFNLRPVKMTIVDNIGEKKIVKGFEILSRKE